MPLHNYFSATNEHEDQIKYEFIDSLWIHVFTCPNGLPLSLHQNLTNDILKTNYGTQGLKATYSLFKCIFSALRNLRLLYLVLCCGDVSH